MKNSFNTPNEHCVSLVLASPPEDLEPCTGNCLKGDCLCKDHDTKAHFIHWLLLLFFGMKKGRSLFTIVHKDLLEMEQLLRWLLNIYLY